MGITPLFYRIKWSQQVGLRSEGPAFMAFEGATEFGEKIQITALGVRSCGELGVLRLLCETFVEEECSTKTYESVVAGQKKRLVLRSPGRVDGEPQGRT
jgi:hypothetical protein